MNNRKTQELLRTVLPEQTPCQVFLHLDGGQGGPTIEAQGLVTRADPQTLAIQFTELIGNESTHHLRNLVLYNSGIQANAGGRRVWVSYGSPC